MESLNLDLVYQVPHFVQAGETLSSHQPHRPLRWQGLNQSIAAARAGERSATRKIGGDGTVLTDILRKSRVDTDFVTVGDGPSGHAVIQVDPSGRTASCSSAAAIRRSPPRRSTGRWRTSKPETISFCKMRSTAWTIS